MRDPRLAELELLVMLESRPKDGTSQNLPVDAPRFGLEPLPLREMLYELLLDGCLNGAADILAAPRAGSDAIDATDENVRRDLDALRRRVPLALQINHRGRLRLWRLLDELRADRGREQFGILYDKRAWERELSVQALFASEERPWSVLYIDLDHFKAVNDNCGHDEGDKALKRYLEIVRDVVGADGDGYRIGGDEVTVSLPGVRLDRASDIAEVVRVKIETEFTEWLEPRPTASIGVATFDRKVDAAEAAKFADDLLYESKKNGRNRITARRYGESE